MQNDVHTTETLQESLEEVIQSTADSAAPTLVPEPANGLFISECCYYFMVKGGVGKRVTNFVLDINKEFIEFIPNIGEDRRVGVRAKVFSNSKYVGTVYISEDDWNSKSGFTSAFNGIGNLTYLGSDEEVKRMKSALLNDIDTKAKKIRRVHSYGIHHTKVAGQDVFTYVEPNWSIDNYGNENLYSLFGKIAGAPKLQFVPPISENGDAELTHCFKLLFRINAPITVATLLGWNMAAFLKQHIFSYRNEFPLLSVWGNAESGKTQTTGLFSALHGVFYLGGTNDSASPISLGGVGASPFAVWTGLSESMTVPKLVEEFNIRSLGRKYEEYVEHFKKAYNQHAVKRGTIRQSKLHGSGYIDAYTVDIPLTAPTLLISEQSIQIPALVQRCIQVQMSEDQRRGPNMESSFYELKRSYTKFAAFARAAYLEAIHISAAQVDRWVEQWYDQVPMSMGDRPHYCYCVALAGLNFLDYLDSKYNLGLSEDIDYLRKTLLAYVQTSSGEIAKRKTVSEVDRLMEEFAVMAELTAKDEGFRWLAKDVFYIRQGEYLYLDGVAAHASYMRYSTSQRQSPIIATYAQFRELVQNASYCESVATSLEGFAGGRNVMQFNIAKLAARGIEVGCFRV